MIVNIPVHPLSLKVIARDYAHGIDEEGVLSLSAGDLLIYQISCLVNKDKERLTAAKKLLTGSITIKISRSLRKDILDNLHIVGIFLYKSHVQLMLKWIDAQVDHLDNVRLAIRNFYDYYGLDESDFDMETAYKQYQRERDKNRTSKPSRKRVELFENISKQILIDEEDIYCQLQLFVNENRIHFLTYTRKFNHFRFEGCLVAMYYDTGKYRYAAIAKILNKDVANVFRNHMFFKSYLNEHEALKLAYSKIMSSLVK